MSVRGALYPVAWITLALNLGGVAATDAPQQLAYLAGALVAALCLLLAPRRP